MKPNVGAQIGIGAVLAGLAVVLGAFGAHGLRDRLGEGGIALWQTGAHYHLVHALAIIVSALCAEKIPAAKNVAWCFVIGVVIFSGSLYALALTGIRGFGAITPFGGVALILGWAWLAWAAFRARS